MTTVRARNIRQGQYVRPTGVTGTYLRVKAVLVPATKRFPVGVHYDNGVVLHLEHNEEFDTLTAPQAAMLADVQAAGSKTYNGRARRTIKALEAAGLVEVDWDMRAQAKGGGIELVEVITVTPKGA